MVWCGTAGLGMSGDTHEDLLAGWGWGNCEKSKSLVTNPNFQRSTEDFHCAMRRRRQSANEMSFLAQTSSAQASSLCPVIFSCPGALIRSECDLDCVAWRMLMRLATQNCSLNCVLGGTEEQRGLSVICCMPRTQFAFHLKWNPGINIQFSKCTT